MQENILAFTALETFEPHELQKFTRIASDGLLGTRNADYESM